MNIFDIEIRNAEFDGDHDLLIILGADEDGDDLAIAVAPSEDREPYDAALLAAGFEPVGDNQARRA